MKDKIIMGVMVLMLLLSLFPTLYISKYSRPSADDFPYSIATHQVAMESPADVPSVLWAAFETDVRFYNKWQGLYTSAFLLALQPGIWGDKYYGVGAVILILVCILLCWLACRIVLKNVLGLPYPNIVGILLGCFLVQQVSCATEGFYWFNGAWNYTPTFFLTMLNIALVWYGIHSDASKIVFISCILSFLISGGNHVCGFLNILLLLWGLIYVWYYKVPQGKQILPPLLMAIIGFCVMYFAPGTSVRASACNSAGVFETIYMSGIHTILISLDWLSAPILLLVVLSILYVFFYSTPIDSKKAVHPIVVWILAYITLSGLWCAPYYAMSTFGAGRLVNVVYWTYILFLIGGAMYTTRYAMGNMSFSLTKEMRNYFVAYAFFVILISCFLKSSLFYDSQHEIRHGVPQYFASCYDARIEGLLQQDGGEMEEVEPLPNQSLIYFSDITNDASFWATKGFNAYYSTKAVLKIE